MNESHSEEERSVSPISFPHEDLQKANGGPTIEMNHLAQDDSEPLKGRNCAMQPPPTTLFENYPLRYHWKTLFLLVFYLTCLILPWVFICILKYRPLTKSSYISQAGNISPSDIKRFSAALTAVQILNTMAALGTITIISSIIAHAAVLYSQRGTERQILTTTFALADCAWLDIPFLWRSKSKEHPSSLPRRRFVYLAASFIVFSIIQPPIQQLLTKTTQIQVPTCKDVKHSYDSDGPCSSDYLEETYTSIAGDPEPAMMTSVPLAIVAQDILTKTATFSEKEIQTNIWKDSAFQIDEGFDNRVIVDFGGESLRSYFNQTPQGVGYFVSALRSDTTTAVLRQHAIRLNSSISCTPMTRLQFPRNCDGSNPFVTSFATNQGNNVTNLEVNVCVPGNQTMVPWTISRDRQDITEEFFLDVNLPNYQEGQMAGNELFNFTTFCKAQSTRGYFELGNERNNGVAGSLLDKWPDANQQQTEFNDAAYDGKAVTVWDDYDIKPIWKMPLDVYTDPWGASARITPGPLTSSVIALFGNGSFLSTIMQPTTNNTQALQSVCRLGAIPFQRFEPHGFAFDNMTSLISLCSSLLDPNQYRSQQYAPVLLPYYWLAMFGDVDSSAKALSAGMFFANQAVLTESVNAGDGSRDIYTSPGAMVTKPDISLGGMIAVTILIGLQVLALLGLVAYVYHAPSPASSIDSAALAGMGRSLRNENGLQGRDR